MHTKTSTYFFAIRTMKLFSIFIFLFLFLSFQLKAQDPHFSQFFASPLTLNPALTGKFDGDLRVAGNYRNQWPTLDNYYRTFSVSVDFDILKNKIPEHDTWGVGFLGMKDEAGGKILTNNYFGVSTSYHKALDEDGFQQIGIGFQGTYGQKRLNNQNLLYEDMLTPFGFTGVTHEIYNNNQLDINYFDLGAGILYSGSTTDRNNFYVGASMYHINRPKESFKGGSWNLAPRTTIHGGGYFPISDLLTFHGSGIYQMQSGSSETVLGGAISAVFDEQSASPSNVYLGSWIRLNDAIIPYIGLEYSGFRIGISYDINTSSLKSSSQSRGGMEVSLIYIKRSSGAKIIPCPIF
jgi:type IX secretion system PorP/SprF family membrane protein